MNRINRRRAREHMIANTLSAGHGTHSAKHFNDTSDGSVHCFLDEHGHWITYTFDEKGLGKYKEHLYRYLNIFVIFLLTMTGMEILSILQMLNIFLFNRFESHYFLHVDNSFKAAKQYQYNWGSTDTDIDIEILWLIISIGRYLDCNIGWYRSRPNNNRYIIKLKF